MKIIAITSRYLLGLLFTVFGLNGFLHFIPQPPPSNPVALQFLTAVSVSHFSAWRSLSSSSEAFCFSPGVLSLSRSRFLRPFF